MKQNESFLQRYLRRKEEKARKAVEEYLENGSWDIFE